MTKEAPDFGNRCKTGDHTCKKKETIADKAIEFLSQIFGAMNLEVSITAAYNEEEQELSLNLEGDDMGILIGKRGQTLDSLQYLVSLIVNKEQKAI